MTNEASPYIESCSFCGNGLLRFRRCLTCDDVVAVCDECELMWQDIAALSQDPNSSADSAYPQCPACGEERAEFDPVALIELEEKKLDRFCAGESV